MLVTINAAAMHAALTAVAQFSTNAAEFSWRERGKLKWLAQHFLSKCNASKYSGTSG